MHLHFSKIARGPGWERWFIVEDQLDDSAIAGEVILTYTDIGSYADAQCDVLFGRELEDTELEELLDGVSSILSGRGNVTVFSSQEVISKEFSLVESDEEPSQN